MKKQSTAIGRQTGSVEKEHKMQAFNIEAIGLKL